MRAADGREAPHPGALVAALAAAGLPFAVIATAVVPTLPTLERELGASTQWTAWTVTTFLVVAAVTTPLIARLGDQHGRQRALVATLVVLLASLIAATFAWDIWSLIVFRAIQGVSGAVFPLAFAIIREHLPPRRVGASMGAVASIGGVGGAIGLLLGGLVLDVLSWRWIFGLTAIGTLFAIAAVERFVPRSRVRKPQPLDVPGALLLSGGLALLLVGLTLAPDLGWSSAATVAMLLAAILILLVWGVVERRVAAPLVDMRMLAEPAILRTNLASLAAGFAMFSTFVVVPPLVETPSGLSSAESALVDYGLAGTPTMTGVLILPASALIVITGLVLGWLSGRVPPRNLFVAGLGVLAFATALIALWHDEPWQLAVAMVPFGIGVGAVLALAPRLVTDAARSGELAVATGMNAVVRMVGQVIGAQVAAAILATVTIASTSIPSEDAFTAVFWASTAAALVSAAVAAFAGGRLRRAPVPRPASAAQ